MKYSVEPRLRDTPMLSQHAEPMTWFQLSLAVQRLFFTNFLRSLPYALVPVVLLTALLLVTYAWSVVGEIDEHWALYLSAAIMVLSPALFAPLVYQVHAFAHGRRVSASAALRRGLSCFLPCVAAAALYILAVAIGSVLLLLPGLYFFVSLSFWWLELVVEGRPIHEAFAASHGLVRGHWWRPALVSCMVIGVVNAVNAFDVSTVTTSEEIVPVILASLLSLVVLSVTPMFFCVGMVVVHHDLTLRSKPSDSPAA